VIVNDSTFRRNAAASAGGAIYNQCVAVVTGTTFDQNTAGSGGGAIEQETGCLGTLSTILTLSLTGSQVRGNSARRSGGGIYTSGPDSVTLTSSVVQANRPDNCAPAGSVPGCAG